MSTVKAKAKEAVKEVELKAVLKKETKGAVAFDVEGLESSTIYFKKGELEQLGLVDKKEFTMVIRA